MRTSSIRASTEEGRTADPTGRNPHQRATDMGKKPRNRKPNPRPNAPAAPTAVAEPPASTMTMEPPSGATAHVAPRHRPAFHPHAIGAVFARNYLAYFSNPA